MTAIQENDNDENNKQNNGYWNKKNKIRKHDCVIYQSWKVFNVWIVVVYICDNNTQEWWWWSKHQMIKWLLKLKK